MAVDEGHRVSRKRKPTNRFLMEEGQAKPKPRKQAKLDEKSIKVELTHLSAEQAAAKLVGVVSIRKFFPRFGYFNGLIMGLDSATGRFQVSSERDSLTTRLLLAS